MIIKASIGSMFRQICALCDEMPDDVVVRRIMQESITTDAIAGSGKSTTISKMVKNDDIVIA